MIPDKDPKPGEHFGSYELVRPLGSGGMGIVYEGRHRTLGRRVAIKVVRGSQDGAVAEIERRNARFLREGRAAAQVRHPNVVDVFDFGVHEGTPFLVMELVEGETFAHLLRRAGKLTLAGALEILLPIMSAVAELHAAGIIHRDLKPSNVLLARERSGALCPKLADFGVSRIQGDGRGVTESGVVLGTLEYLSPEQTRGTHGANEAADQYALGVMLYEAITGERPFVGASSYELMHAIVTAEMKPPTALVPSLPAELEAVVLRALSRDPAARFAAVDELGEALLPFASPAVTAQWRAEFVSTERYAAAPSRPRLPASVRWLWRLAIVLVAAFAIVAGVRLVRHPEPSAIAAPTTTPTIREDAPSAIAARVDSPEPLRTTSEPTAASPAPLSRVPAPHRVAKPAAPRAASASAGAKGENDAPILEVE